MSTIPLEKQTLRARALTLLRALGPAERAEKSMAIARHLGGLAGLTFGFAPLRLEPDWLSAWGGGDFALPRIEPEGLAFHRVTAAGATTLVGGPFGTREPAVDPITRVAPEEAATILVPGLAFDRDGGRLGRGGGFYDRFLASPGLHARRIGVCFACQVIERVPREPHDAWVDVVVTEDGWLEPRNSLRGRD